MTDFSMDGRASCQSAFANLTFVIRDSFDLANGCYWFGANARLTFENLTGNTHEFTFLGGIVGQSGLRIPPRRNAVVFTSATGAGPFGGTMVHVNSRTQSDVVVCPNAGVVPSAGPAAEASPASPGTVPQRVPHRLPRRQGPQEVRPRELSPGDRIRLPNGCIIEHEGERVMINCPRTITR